MPQGFTEFLFLKNSQGWSIRLTQLPELQGRKQPHPQPLGPSLTPQSWPCHFGPNGAEWGRLGLPFTKHNIFFFFNCRESFSMSEVGPCYLQQVMFSLTFGVCTCVMKKGVTPKRIQVGPALLLGSGLTPRTSSRPQTIRAVKLVFLYTHIHADTQTYMGVHAHTHTHKS